MKASTSLSVQLANTALAETDRPTTAVTALMSGAAAILQRDFGPEIAAQLLVNMVIEARLSLIGDGLVAEPLRH